MLIRLSVVQGGDWGSLVSPLCIPFFSVIGITNRTRLLDRRQACRHVRRLIRQGLAHQRRMVCPLLPSLTSPLTRFPPGSQPRPRSRNSLDSGCNTCSRPTPPPSAPGLRARLGSRARARATPWSSRRSHRRSATRSRTRPSASSRGSMRSSSPGPTRIRTRTTRVGTPSRFHTSMVGY